MTRRAPWPPHARYRQAKAAAASARRQRERMVGSTRPGAWLTSSSRARRGGSSSTLSSALAPADIAARRRESTIATRQPPSPAVEPKNVTVLRTSSTAIACAACRLIVDGALEHQQVALRLRCDPARHRMIGGDRERSAPIAPPAPSGRDGRARSAPCDRPASPCRCRAARRSARHAACAAAIGVEQRALGLGVAEQARSSRADAGARPRHRRRRLVRSRCHVLEIDRRGRGIEPFVHDVPDGLGDLVERGALASIRTQRSGSPAASDAGRHRAASRGTRSSRPRTGRPRPRPRALGGAREPDIGRHIEDEGQIGLRSPTVTRSSPRIRRGSTFPTTP